MLEKSVAASLPFARDDSTPDIHPIDSSLPEEYPYRDNYEHLMALEMETRLHFIIAQQEVLERSSWPFSENVPKTAGRDKSLHNDAPKPSTAQLVRNLKTMKARRAKRESLNRAKGNDLLFDKLATLYGLDLFERDVLMLLFFSATSHSFKSMLENSVFKSYIEWDGIEVGAILTILEPEFKNQIKRRRHFSVDAPLIRNEIIVGRNNHYDRYGSILDENFCVHQRVVNYIMGDDNVYSLDMTCIEIIQSRVDLEKLILPEQTKASIIEQVAQFVDASKRRSDLNLTGQFGYGTGMVCLFHGPSGTGKTMLAHGLANHFGMNLLLVNMEAGKAHNQSLEEIIKYAFREACLTNSIVFFDECDDIFKADTYDSRALLVEIEKAEGITILATNRAVDLDPALDRRIQLKVPLPMPGADERARIWKALIPEGVCLDTDVNLRELAEKFCFSGGLIKNVLLAAINMAAQGSQCQEITLTHAILSRSAKRQSGQASHFDRMVNTYEPDRSIDSLLLNEQDKRRLKNLADCEKYGVLEKTGQGSLILSDDLDAAVQALEAVACKSGLMVRKYLLSDLLSPENKEQRLVNPLTHEPMKPHDIPFLHQNGCRSATILVDDNYSVAGYLGEKDSQNEEVDKLMDCLHSSDAHLYLAVRGKPGVQLPKGIARIITIGFPPERIQIQEWEKNIKDLSGMERYICQIVENHPMHPCQIHSVCREAALRSSIEHGSKERMCEFIEDVILERGENQPLLFGKEG